MSTQTAEAEENKWTVVAQTDDGPRVQNRPTRSDALEAKEEAESLGAKETSVFPPGEMPGESDDATEPEVVEDDAHPEQADGQPEVDNDTEVLAQDPIQWLESKNSEFVYTKKGTPAISKQGFRYIQQRFDISTESEVVETFDDPLGVIVWAKATGMNGQTAEAHGEAWQFESDVDDNEFVRYADTRSKNRAISDLTSAGVLAVSELSGGQE